MIVNAIVLLEKMFTLSKMMDHHARGLAETKTVEEEETGSGLVLVNTPRTVGPILNP